MDVRALRKALRDGVRGEVRFDAGSRGAYATDAVAVCARSGAPDEHQQGDQEEALRWFERDRAACGPPGLCAEECDITRRRLRGNLPQAFVHALMTETATRLSVPAGRR